MAEKIKGITIEFNGNATPLQKAIREVNSDLNKTTKELSQINKALKFNPTSLDLWKQKQELLTKKVSETEEKLGMLKKAQKQMDAAGVDKSSEEYRNLQREIVETESKLKTFKAQLREVGNVKLKVLSEQFKQIGSKATEVGTSLTKNVTVPIAAVGAASIKAFNEVKDGLNIVAQKTGATGDELKEMQDITRNLAKTIPTDFESAGTAVGELNTRFGVTGQELEKLSEQYIKFAKVNGVDLNASIDETQKALAAFGMSAADAPKLLDTLTKAGQMTGASVDSLTQGLIQNATAFQELGLNMDQSVMLMAQMEKSGANSETVMQGLRKALKNAAAEGKPLDQALSELQKTIENGSGSMDGLTAAYDLFGKSGDQIYGAVKNGTLDFEALGKAVADTGGTLDSVFEETLTPAEKFQTTMNSVKDAGYELGNTIMTMLAPYMEKLAAGAQKLSEWWSNLDDGTKQLITKIGMFAAVIGPVLVVVGKLATGIGAIINVVSMASGAFAAIGGVIGGVAAGPILAIIAAVVAVIAIFKVWKEHGDQIKEFFINFGKKIAEVWTNLKTAVVNKITEIKNGITTAFTAIKNFISTMANAWFDAMTWPYRKAWEIIKGIVEKIKSFFPIKIGDFFGHIKLPHFKLEGTFSLNPPSVPKLKIDWYDKGGIFKSPSIIGVGEKRPEFVGALDDLRTIVREESGGGTGGGVVINVYATPGMNEEELARKIEQKLVAMQKQRNMAYGSI